MEMRLLELQAEFRRTRDPVVRRVYRGLYAQWVALGGNR
jgi:hypothetical protein